MNQPNQEFRTIKNNLSKVVRDERTQVIIWNAVSKVNKLVIHALHLIKLYILNKFDAGNYIPEIDVSLIQNCFRVLVEVYRERNRVGHIYPRRTRESIRISQELKIFHITHYLPLMNQQEELDSQYLSQCLHYAAVDLQQDLETNLVQHFTDYIARFVNVVMEKRERLANLNELQKKIFIRRLYEIKSNILDVNRQQLIEPLLAEHISEILPQGPFRNNNLFYDIKCRPQAYLRPAIYMNQYIQSKGEKSLNVFPLRTSIVPKYILLDTDTIIRLLVNEGLNLGPDSTWISKWHMNIKEHQDEIWSHYFRTDKKCFGNTRSSRYKFNCIMRTDGLGCSINLIHKDAPRKCYIQKRRRVEPPTDLYIDDEQVDIESIYHKKCVGIDRNMRDLVYCSTVCEDDSTVHFRYTSDQRRKETGSKYYSRWSDNVKQNAFIEDKTVKEWEAQLSQHNKKSLMVEWTNDNRPLPAFDFKVYLEQKNLINSKLFEFYECAQFRSIKWRLKVNRQRSEQKMINNFKEKFGPPQETFIALGDWSPKRSMRNHEPAKIKGMGKVFKKAGYEVYLVDEHRTSSRCYNCEGGECVTFRYCPHPRPYRRYREDGSTRIVLRHGLLMCQTCKCPWNRDVNASLNIRRIALCAIEDLPRPSYLCRQGGNASSNTGRRIATLTQ